MKNQFLLGLSLLVMAGCSNSGGSSGGQTPQSNSTFKPTISDDYQFEAISDLNSDAFFLNSKCSKDIAIDPRLKPGQKFIESREGQYQSGQIYRQTDVTEIKSVGPEVLQISSQINSEHAGISLSWALNLTHNCSKTDGHLSCKTSEPEIVTNSGPAPVMKSNETPETKETPCDRKWVSVSDYEGKEMGLVPSRREVQLGQITLKTGEKILAVKSVFTGYNKDSCQKPVIAKTNSVQIMTLNVPNRWASNTHCFATVYDQYSLTDNDSGKLISEDRSALISQPTQSELGNYPGFENIKEVYESFGAVGK